MTGFSVPACAVGSAAFARREARSVAVSPVGGFVIYASGCMDFVPLRCRDDIHEETKTKKDRT